MYRIYIPLTFLFLGLAFYGGSGGSDFVPQTRAEQPAPDTGPVGDTTTADAATADDDATFTAQPDPQPEPQPEPQPDPQPEPQPIAESPAPAAPAPSAAADPVAIAQAGAEAATAAADGAFTSLADAGSNQIGFSNDAGAIPTPAPEADPTALLADVRTVTGDRVNMRSGPGTAYPVLATLELGTQVAVLEQTSNGWARIEVAGTFETGWMSLRLLSEPDQ